MKALCWMGTSKVEVHDVPDPAILNLHDAVIKVTRTAICGSDLHLLDGFIPTMEEGDILGHEFMGVVEETGSEVSNLLRGDRVLVPFTIACGSCEFCKKKLWSACDNTNPKDIRIRTVEERLGAIDVLINNAGTIQVGPLENQTIEDFQEAMRSNFWPAVHTTMAVIPGMKRRRFGRIVNIASIGGKIAGPHLLPYSVSKFALIGFSKGLRTELKKDGISVTTVVPGLMRTGSPGRAEVTGQHGKEYSWFVVSDSLPGISIDVQRAARQIVDACVAGSAEIVLGGVAQFAAVMNALAPNVVAEILAAVNEWVLSAAAEGYTRKKGSEIENALTRSFLTFFNRKATCV